MVRDAWRASVEGPRCAKCRRSRCGMEHPAAYEGRLAWTSPLAALLSRRNKALVAVSGPRCETPRARRRRLPGPTTSSSSSVAPSASTLCVARRPAGVVFVFVATLLGSSSIGDAAPRPSSTSSSSPPFRRLSSSPSSLSESQPMSVTSVHARADCACGSRRKTALTLPASAAVLLPGSSPRRPRCPTPPATPAPPRPVAPLCP